MKRHPLLSALFVLLATGALACNNAYLVNPRSEITNLVIGNERGPRLTVRSVTDARVQIDLNGVSADLLPNSLRNFSYPRLSYIGLPCGETVRVKAVFTAPDLRVGGRPVRPALREWIFQSCAHESQVVSWTVEVYGDQVVVNGW